MTLSEDGTPVSESPSLLIIVATYNEIDSLPRLIGRLREELPAATLLVIDDASPDGTGNWCEQARQRDSRLHVIHREGKLGLGSAACCGISSVVFSPYLISCGGECGLFGLFAELSNVAIIWNSVPFGNSFGSFK